MTWNNVFACIGITVALLLLFRILHPFYSLIMKEIFIIKRKRLIEKTNSLNTAGARASLPLKLAKLEEMIPNDIEWESEYRTMFMILAVTTIGLILAHFGISGRGNYIDD